DEQMHMRVDTGGNDDVAVGINHLGIRIGGCSGASRQKRGDFLALGYDIQKAGAFWCHDFAIGDDQAHYTVSNAWLRSAIRSSVSSIPTEMRTRRSEIPIASRCSAGTEKCDVFPGCEIRLSTPPT